MAWSRVQAGVVADSIGASLANTATFGANITAGNLVPWQCTWGSTTTTDLSSVTSGGATATIKARVVDTADTQTFAIGYFINHPGGVKTVVQNMASSIADLQMLVSEFTSTGVSTATNSGGTVVVQSSPPTTTDGVKTGTTFGLSGDLRWGCVQEDGSSSAAFTPGTGYTADKINTSDPNFFNLSSMTEWMTASGAADVTFTFGTSGSVGVGGLSFTPGGGAGITVNLAGQQNSSGQGILGIVETASLPGQAGNSGQGTLIADILASITGQQVQTQQGTLTAVALIDLLGQSMISGQGIIQIPTIFFNLTGQRLSSAIGSLTTSLSPKLSGQAGTAGQGILSSKAIIVISGQAGNSGQGLIQAIVPGGPVSFSLLGQAGISSAGVLSAEIAPNLSRQSIVSSLGGIIGELLFNLEGQHSCIFIGEPYVSSSSASVTWTPLAGPANSWTKINTPSNAWTKQGTQC